jgi:hypothetical protein
VGVLLDHLPFLTTTRPASDKNYPLDTLYPLLGNKPPFSSHQTPPPVNVPKDPNNQAVEIKTDQILVWVGLSDLRTKNPPAKSFPAHLDLGCGSEMVISEWHLRNWASDTSYDPLGLAVREYVPLRSASQGPSTSTVPPPTNIPLRTALNAIKQLAKQHGNQAVNWAPVIATDIWLAGNRRGERDELATPHSWFRLKIKGIAITPGDVPRIPLVGMPALQYAAVVAPDGTKGKLDRFSLHVQASTVSLRYS